jgi:hypothetical protein
MYNITKTDGTIIKEIGENIIDFDTISNIGLIGKLSPNYGETQSNNFVHLVENFAGTTTPENPLSGMIFFNKTDNSLYVCTDATQKTWTKMASLNFEKPKSPQRGDMFYDQDDKQLFIFDDSIDPFGDWVLIGPDNYMHKQKVSSVIETSKSMGEGSYTIDLDSEKVGLITLKIVASEKISTKSVYYTKKVPACSAWIYKLLVNNYVSATGDYAIMVGSPTYELIGQTDDAKDWTVNVEVKDNQLVITVNATISDKNTSIQWEVDGEILKV